MPINDSLSFINIADAVLAKVNHNSGEICELFNEEKLQQKFLELLTKTYEGIYISHTEKELNGLPYCQRQNFIYNRFYKIRDTHSFANEIICMVKNLRTTENEVIKMVVFFDENFKIIRINERESVSDLVINPNEGGFYVNLDNYFI